VGVEEVKEEAAGGCLKTIGAREMEVEVVVLFDGSRRLA